MIDDQSTLLTSSRGNYCTAIAAALSQSIPESKIGNVQRISTKYEHLHSEQLHAFTTRRTRNANTTAKAQTQGTRPGLP